MTVCNKDYSQKIAATGVGAVSVANPFLDGSGSLIPVFNAGKAGAVVRSIIIKAIAPTLSGMVRLFIGKKNAPSVLFKEVPVPVNPNVVDTPVPAPKYIMFETVLIGGMKLQAGQQILASTQNAEVFNIIVEAINWTYPEDVHPQCCNYLQTAANTGVKIISVANQRLNGAGAIVSIFSAGAGAGSLIKKITITALQNTHEGVVRLFITDTAAQWRLMREVWVQQTEQSAFEPSFHRVVEMDFYLKAGLSIGASTENAESFAITVDAVNLNYPI